MENELDRTFEKQTEILQFLESELSSTRYNFIAFAISPWHALGVDAFVYDYLSNMKGNKCRGIVVIVEHELSGFVIDSSAFICRNWCAVEFVFLRTSMVSVREYKAKLVKVKNLCMSLLKPLKYVKHDRSCLYCIAPMNPNYLIQTAFSCNGIAKRYYPCHIMIDEGFAQYCSPLPWFFENNKESRFKWHLLARFITQYYLRKCLNRIICAVSSMQNRSIFKKNNLRLHVRNNVAKSYKTILQLKLQGHQSTFSFNNIQSNSVVFLSQPWSEYGTIDHNKEEVILNNIIKILERLNLQLIIKSHPREDKDKYFKFTGRFNESVAIIQEDLLAEEVFAFKPLCVIGYTSTSLITARAIYNIPAISISSILSYMCDNEYYSSGTKEFKQLTKNLVIQCNSYNQLKDVIVEITNKGITDQEHKIVE